MKNHSDILTLRRLLPQVSMLKHKALIGLDGFIDEVVHAVDQRIDCKNYTRIEKIAQYGQRILDSAGLSGNIEIVTVSRKIGGNGAIFASELLQLGIDVSYIGSVGVRLHDAVFDILSRTNPAIGIAEPGKTDAIEFKDGKIISSKLDSLNQMSWADVKRMIPPADFAKRIDAANLVSFNNWTMIPAMSVIWKGIIEEVLPITSASFADKKMFIDLADPAKRSDKDICNALMLLEKFNALGFQVILGLNKKECHELLRATGHFNANQIELPLEALVQSVAECVDISGIVVHPVDKAGVLFNGVYSEVEGPYCASPAITTGAGDHFNAGFVFGWLNCLPMVQCLLLGVATSGFYVRTSISPTIDQLRAFLLDWANLRQ